MKLCKYIILFVLLVGWSCQTQTDEEQKEEIEQGEVVDEIEDNSKPPCDEKLDTTSDSNDCDLYFYTSTRSWEKKPTYFCGKFQREYLCERLSFNRLLVGFYVEVDNAEIVNFLNQTKMFEPVDENDIDRDPYFESWKKNLSALLWVKTQETQTYTQLNEMIDSLKMSPLVKLAELTFYLEPGTIENPLLAAYPHYIYLQVKDKNDLSDLYAVMEETNTWINYHHADFIDGDIFAIGVDKNSKGNARQMANYFLETGKFVQARPMLEANGPTIFPQ